MSNLPNTPSTSSSSSSAFSSADLLGMRASGPINNGGNGGNGGNLTSLKRKVPSGLPESMREIHEHFLCPICFNILEEAHVTKCGHTFCYKCITDALVDSNRCPQCNFTVEHFYPNFLLNELISKYKIEKHQETIKKFQRQSSDQPSELKMLFLEKQEELSLPEINQLVELLKEKKSQLEETIHSKQSELLKEFLERALKHKSEQFEQVQRDVKNVSDDYDTLLEMIKVDTGGDGGGGGGDDEGEEANTGEDTTIQKEGEEAATLESPNLSDGSSGDQAVPLSSADRAALLERVHQNSGGASETAMITTAGISNMVLTSSNGYQVDFDQQRGQQQQTSSSSTDHHLATTSTTANLSTSASSYRRPSTEITEANEPQPQPKTPVFSKSPHFVPTFNSLGFGRCEHTEPARQATEHRAEHYLNVRRKKMNFYFHDLEKNYFSRFGADAFHQTDARRRLTDFRETLTKFTHFSNLRPLASLSYAKDFVVHNIVSSIEFDKDAEFFAIAGVAKKIKIFDYAAVVKDSLGINYPVNEIDCSSKISCLSWNSYFKAMMATSDYEGSVILWDAFLGKKLSVYQEHEKRCWSVDFNRVDINLVASGSDDGKVKLWSANMDSSITTLNSPANICSVKFNPASLYHLAYGSADHRVYYYDLRNTRTPLTVFKEHRKAVSYVKFLNRDELVSASTDSQIKLWSTEQLSCLRSYTGHLNEKNFVGLTTNEDYIACGSENNSLYVYYKGIERQMLSYCFERIISQEGKDESTDFVSAICWRTGSNVLVAANSTGNIKILELV